MKQNDILQFMKKNMTLDKVKERRMEQIYAHSGIEYRHTVLQDFSRDTGNYTFFSNATGLLPMPDVSTRMKLYEDHALQLCVDASKDCLKKVPHLRPEEITHLITVSCTGMYAPGLDMELPVALGIPMNVARTCINFMGCYAAVNALKTADHIVRSDPSAKVLIADVELCTIHFQNSEEYDQMVSNAIFSDGAAAVMVCSRDYALEYNLPSLEMMKFYSEFAPEGKSDMIWNIRNNGFEIRLSMYVPKMIQGGIKNLVSRLKEKAEISSQTFDYYAIHPGGRKILEVCESELEITKEHNNLSYEVLKNYGNMSSVTILFILNEWMKKLKPEDYGKNILSCAFGPEYN